MANANLTEPNDGNQLTPRHTVLRLLAIVAVSIFATETVLMFIFDRLPAIPALTGDLLDGTLLTILISPILYLYLFRPMNNYIVELREAKGLLRQQRDHLEEEVQHRTAELVERNEQQAQLMRELKSAEEKYRSLVEHLPSVTYILNLEDEEGLAFVSPQIEQLGFGAKEWIETPDFRFQRTHPEDRNRVRQAFLHSRNTGEPFRCDYRLFSRTNEVRWFQDEARVVRDEAGKMLFLQGVMLDVTEKKAMEQELAEHRYQLEQRVGRRTELLERRISVLDAANTRLCKMLDEFETGQRQSKRLAPHSQLLNLLVEDAVIVVNPDGLITFLNPAAEQLLKVDGEKVLRRPLAEALTLVDNDRLNIQEMQRRCLTGKQEKLQLESATLQQKDGGSVAVFGWFAPIVDVDGKATSLIVLLHPVVAAEGS